MSQEEPFVHIHNFKSSLMRIYARPGAHDAALSAIKIAIPKILDEQFPGVLSFEENGSDMVERPPLPPRNAIKVQAPRTNVSKMSFRVSVYLLLKCRKEK
jgi:hypothetical protein